MYVFYTNFSINAAYFIVFTVNLNCLSTILLFFISAYLADGTIHRVVALWYLCIEGIRVGCRVELLNQVRSLRNATKVNSSAAACVAHSEH